MMEHIILLEFQFGNSGQGAALALQGYKYYVIPPLRVFHVLPFGRKIMTFGAPHFTPTTQLLFIYLKFFHILLLIKMIMIAKQ